ncbi:HORMA domain-containing protein 2 [Eurytemora carolleeae]|uniref:HORMA domain-containing protein 2 n=1 Tax=Eurytemora carolleeae TaxID=1294199 RepID=UPI000C758503|nr:HORMA domain-containing protein 2 [Eurytemora carolleeae]|eukprot:XP_023324971.1 HORMA domain-containing protein 2-like [Eurytemora affinis]
MSNVAQVSRINVSNTAPVQGESLMNTETWAQHFPTTINTEQKLLTTALSSLTYIRGLLPEHCYANRKMDEIPIKVLLANTDHPIAKALATCLEGTFEALEKKYLKEFFFIIFLDKDDPDGSVYEMYNFSFSYSDGVTSMHGTSNKAGMKYENKIYNSTRLLLRNLCFLTQTFEPVPDEAYLTVKLTYHENTPDEYEPPGFSPSGTLLIHSYSFLYILIRCKATDY